MNRLEEEVPVHSSTPAAVIPTTVSTARSSQRIHENIAAGRTYPERIRIGQSHVGAVALGLIRSPSTLCESTADTRLIENPSSKTIS